jgi:hypothetical protein
VQKLVDMDGYELARIRKNLLEHVNNYQKSIDDSGYKEIFISGSKK